MSKEWHPCCAEVWRFSGPYKHEKYCRRTASVERDGKWYCKMHDPVKIKAKYDARMATKRCKEAAPDMLAALKRLVNIGFQHDAGCHPSEGIHTEGCLEKRAALAQARAAIEKAEGQECTP